ncbi:PAS domain-containing sensor histidine kinase [Holophaga foetida]|uniref:PAS domain-containing sensor histidine kinase n=1 Tax=Holophaga foetida TaxID=35839 RepID=UPI000247532F|nr:ATP-binding protein [Holophaga foetida]
MNPTSPSNEWRSPEALYQALMGSLDACVGIVDATGLLVSVNEQWANYKGRNPFVVGCAPGRSYHEVCKKILTEDGGLGIVALGASSILKGGIPRLHFDFPLQEEEGSHFYEMVAVRPPMTSDVSAVFFFRDITNRMAMERRLKKAESLFKVTTDNALDFICLLDTESRMIYHNTSLQRLLGHSNAWFATNRMIDVVHEEDRARFREAMEKGTSAGLTQIFEYRMANAREQWIHLEGQVSMVEDPGGRQNTLLLVSRDISQRKQSELERAQVEVQLRHAQKMEAVGQLAAGVAHEINTPIQFIGDNLRFLSEAYNSLSKLMDAQSDLLNRASEIPELAEKVQAFRELQDAEDFAYLMQEAPQALSQSMDGVERVSTIVKAMKYFSHPGTVGRVLVDLNHAIASTLTVSRNEWKYVADVETHFDENLPQVPCYPGEFNQVILNIIINAAHAIAEGQSSRGGEKGLITVSTRQTGDWVEIRIKDTGPGIPTPHLPQIWVPFFTTKPVGKGTGQGLSIVHSVMAKHGGTAEAESEVGHGATFILRFPLHPEGTEVQS